LLAAFILGCIAGTVAVRRSGLSTLFPVALAIAVAGLVPVFDDLRSRSRMPADAGTAEAPPKDPRAD
jgi:hypothetical protein